MPIIDRTEEELKTEREQEVEDREFFASIEREKREAQHRHDLNIAKLKYATQPRHKAVARVILGMIKIPVLLVLSVTIPFLIWRGKEVPESLTNFYNF